MSPHKILVQQMVDVQRAAADFREASERRPATSSQTNRAHKHFSTGSPVQKLGPDAEKKMPLKSRLQVACDYELA